MVHTFGALDLMALDRGELLRDNGDILRDKEGHFLYALECITNSEKSNVIQKLNICSTGTTKDRKLTGGDHRVNEEVQNSHRKANGYRKAITKHKATLVHWDRRRQNHLRSCKRLIVLCFFVSFCCLFCLCVKIE